MLMLFSSKNALDATVIFKKKKKIQYRSFSSIILSVFNLFRQGIYVSTICSQGHINATD